MVAEIRFSVDCACKTLKDVQLAEGMILSESLVVLQNKNSIIIKVKDT